jgi:hypothetical protein
MADAERPAEGAGVPGGAGVGVPGGTNDMADG